jgi:alanyl-tRNA synthetase
MENQKNKSKKSNRFDASENINIRTRHITNFTGYSDYKNFTKILDIYIDGENADKINEGQNGLIIIDPCPFYAEAGGQIGDSGLLLSKNGKFEVFDTQKHGSANLLFGKQIDGTFEMSEEVEAEVNKEKRDNIKLNHSATHLLHSALINNIGNNLQQKGSLVSDTKLRFDFSCDKPINRKTLNLIENEVNDNIEKNILAETKLMNKDEAISKGAIALFGEKYDDNVRVLSFGDVSVELCGGTHVNSTGDIGVFKILSESSISSGIRRIEAITGMSANDYLTKRDNIVTDICQSLNVQDEELKNKIDSILNDNKKLKKENSILSKEVNYLKIIETISNKKIISDCNVQVIFQDYVDGKILKNILEDIKSSEKKLILVVLQKNKSKLEIYSLVTKDCFDLITANEIINMMNNDFGSTGGGKDDIAQAGLEYNKEDSELILGVENKISNLIQKKRK